MKRIQNASLAFKQKTPTDKLLFGENVVSELTTNAADYPDLPVSLKNLTSRNTELNGALVGAGTGYHKAVAGVEGVVMDWDNDFSLVAKYVSYVAKGDQSLIVGAGFFSTKGEGQAATKPLAPEDLKVIAGGTKGTVVASSKKGIKGTKAIVFCAAPDGVAVAFDGNALSITIEGKTVSVIVDTRKQTEFYNLQSGTAYNVSMYGINSAGTGGVATRQVIPQ